MQRERKIEYDAIVAGSDASGGWACKRLAEAGLKVALLEAGKPQFDLNFSEQKPAFELKRRNCATDMIRKDVISQFSTFVTKTRLTGS
jgi:choline dehydrogenase-like flavoprotein